MVGRTEALELRQTQLQTYVGFTSFMTVVTTFFTGLLLTQIKNYDISIKVPIAFLLISMFGFLYATLIYTNGSDEIARGKVKTARKHLLMGDVLSEYIGVYLLVLSIPLVMNAITGDGFLRIVSLVASLGGFALYQFSHLSIIEKHFKRQYEKISAALIILGLLVFSSQTYEFYFVELSIILMILILSIAYYATKKDY
ncbi:MAG: hypothetical protein HY513_01765 [Candidatus Aenigmarchaeota archaeon]|nr:hypothetical protein [Candidatus Aenigmarchaeota archaeon]